MNITALFQKRMSIYYKNLGKYLKYVLNDHFVLALLLMVGALGFSYSEYLEVVSAEAFAPRFILIAVIYSFLTAGGIRTLIESADAIFLMPKEKELDKVMIKNLIYSLIIYISIISFLGFITLPLLNALGIIAGNNHYIWLVSLICLKISFIVYKFNALKNISDKHLSLYKVILCISELIILIVSVFLSLTVGVFLSVCLMVASFILLAGTLRTERWNWVRLVETENKRVQSIYRLINLFIETPYSPNKVRRMKLFDNIFQNKLSKESPHTYYLSRVFVRNTTFSGLYIRLVFIGSLLMVFTNNVFLNSGLSVLFLYLIGFQLLPLNQIIQKSLHFKLYPKPNADKISSIQKLLFLLLSFTAVVFALMSINGGWQLSIVLLCVNSLFIWGFVYGYVPSRVVNK